MSVFAVFYTYDPASDLIAQHRPEHREFLAMLKADGMLVGSGPFTDEEGGALIVLRVDDDSTVADVEKLMDDDPFKKRGAITGRTIRPWNPVLNIWNS
ncbi:YciI family protein [Corynebacterium mendelii]|uniref:YCII-related domain-containing protein n=1 Tax=Corynebacterium mendelii TaxID=2765362 RepID=A0A939IX49_9CORY|nr:YciI family protein [Corynebacterium mendelii]MBN9643297.1 hypothetical protein [Corynebacterium mendelii]